MWFDLHVRDHPVGLSWCAAGSQMAGWLGVPIYFDLSLKLL